MNHYFVCTDGVGGYAAMPFNLENACKLARLYGAEPQLIRAHTSLVAPSEDSALIVAKEFLQMECDIEGKRGYLIFDLSSKCMSSDEITTYRQRLAMQALRENQFNNLKAAKALKIGRKTLWRWKNGIRRTK